MAFTWRNDTKAWKFFGTDGSTYKSSTGEKTCSFSFGPFSIKMTSTKFQISVNESGYYSKDGGTYLNSGEYLVDYTYDQHGSVLYLYSYYKMS